jgi:hypothetical protein
MVFVVLAWRAHKSSTNRQVSVAAAPEISNSVAYVILWFLRLRDTSKYENEFKASFRIVIGGMRTSS